MQTKGSCAYCQRVLTRSGMAKHLRTCAARHGIAVRVDESSQASEMLFHLELRDAWSGMYWLHVEVAATASMQGLDRYLRAIWLECCGHSSEWRIGRAWSGEKIGMGAKLGSALLRGHELVHVYDFGTTTETQVRLVDRRAGVATPKRPITLMARNHPPPIPCMKCDARAVSLCMQCVIELDEGGGLCAEHAEEHPHDDYGELMPIVNSPRTGVCGYTGPAEPPW
jgi:hypothetical protein